MVSIQATFPVFLRIGQDIVSANPSQNIDITHNLKGKSVALGNPSFPDIDAFYLVNPQ